MKFKKIIYIFVLLFAIISLSGCGTENHIDELRNKIVKEINYIDSKIISMANLLNGIHLENYKVETKEINDFESADENKQKGGAEEEQSTSSSSQDKESESSRTNSESSTVISEMKTTSILKKNDNPIEWEKIKFEIELMYSTWATIILDLYKINVQGELINQFSNELNNATINITNENTESSLNSLANLYSYLPQLIEYAIDSKEDVNVYETKMSVIKAYYNATIGNWDNARNDINEAIKSYTPIINNLNYAKPKEYAINRIYILLSETFNSLNTLNKEIFFINYKNLINELNVLS